MSKSDQFAVPTDAAASTIKPKPSRFRVFGWVLGGPLTVLILLWIIGWQVNVSARQKPVNQQQVLQSLAGVPIYPEVTFDEDLTRAARGELAQYGWLSSDSKIKTVAGLRTTASPEEVEGFYDSNMAIMGFTKTTLGDGKLPGAFLRGKNGIGGASYTSPDTTVVVQLNKEEGEDNQLIITRFDRTSRSVLTQAPNIVTPEDFKKAQKEAEKKRSQKPAEAPKK